MKLHPGEFDDQGNLKVFKGDFTYHVPEGNHESCDWKEHHVEEEAMINRLADRKTSHLKIIKVCDCTDSIIYALVPVEW